MKKLVILMFLAVSGVAFAQEAPVQVDPSVEAARKACAEAMNKDPSFAKSIVDTVDKQADQKVIDAHTDAAKHIAENERHVILAYAAMWIIAALFVVFLWRRQQRLKLEIVQLRRDLDAAAKESK
jgi:hypothetical protein